MGYAGIGKTPYRSSSLMNVRRRAITCQAGHVITHHLGLHYESDLLVRKAHHMADAQKRAPS